MVDQLQTKGERTRQAILDAAYGRIIEQGYAATSMRQIAERAGLAPGSLYNHFASKGEIFSAILLERHPFLQIMPILNSIEESVEVCAHCRPNLVDQLRHHPDVLNLMLTEIVEFRGEHVPLMFGNFAL
jgi:AcrR family transcriptional regulator